MPEEKSSARPARLSRAALYEWLVSSRLVTVSIFLISLLIGIYWFFPQESMRVRFAYELSRQASLEVSMAELKLLPLLTFQGRDVSLRPVAQPIYNFSFSELYLAPWWQSLFTGTPGVKGEAYGLGGRIFFRFNSRQEVRVAGSGLGFELTIYENPQMTLSASGIETRLEASMPLHQAENGLLDLNADQLHLKGLDAFLSDASELSLGSVSIRAVLAQGILRVEDVTAAGGAFEIDGKGEILLAPDLLRSRMNVELLVRPTPGAPEEMVNLLDLISSRRTDDTYRLHLTGSVSNPLLK